MNYCVPINRKALEDLAYVLSLIAFFLLPLELPLAERNGIVKSMIGGLSEFFYVGHIVLFASLVLLIIMGWKRIVEQVRCNSFWGLSTLYLGVGVLGLLATAFSQNGNVKFSVQQLLLGYLAPIACCGAILACEPAKRRTAWLAFYAGWIGFFLWSLTLLPFSWHSAIALDPIFANATFGQRLFLWRFTFSQDWNLYALFVGNANKTSNNIVIFFLLSTRLLGVDRDRRLLYRIAFKLFGYLGILTLVMLFSRAALFLLPLVIYKSGFWRSIRKPARALALAGIVLTVFIGWASYAAAFNYLLTSTDTFGTSEGVLGTFNDRFNQWNDLEKYIQEHPRELALGMGTGGYGHRFFHDEIRGTHNMFLDVLTESGIPGLGLLIGTLLLALILALIRSRKQQDYLPLIGLSCLILLMFREHSPAYLYVTSLGGLCFTTLFYILCVPANVVKAQL